MNDTEDLDVYQIHRLLRIAVLTDDTQVPVTNWFDRNGDECDPLVAVTCVCGKDGVGWFGVDLTKFTYVDIH